MKMKALLFFETLVTSVTIYVPEDLHHRSRELRASKACWTDRVGGDCIGDREDDDDNDNCDSGGYVDDDDIQTQPQK